MGKGKKSKKKIDGLGPDDIKKIRSALRKVWSWSYPRRIAKARAVGADGFYRCEKCKKKTPHVHVDHIEACGDLLDGGYIKRMWCPSSRLQVLCAKCHRLKTKQERKIDLGF